MVVVEFFPEVQLPQSTTTTEEHQEQSPSQTQPPSPSQSRGYTLHFHGTLPQYMQTLMSSILLELHTTQRVINPTSKEAIEALPKVTIDINNVSEHSRCSVCIEDFRVGECGVVILPCGHLFHEECLLPWLKEHNTCPVCRHELPAESSPRAVREPEVSQ